jgi:hypothetical protein
VTEVLGSCTIARLGEDGKPIWADGRPGRVLLCGQPAVHSEIYVDQGCPDDPEAKPHEMTFRYCAGHKHLAGDE